MKTFLPYELILKTLHEQTSLKQDVYDTTLKNFMFFKATTKKLVSELKKDMGNIDKRLIIEYKDRGEFEYEIRIAGDLLIFSMHTNVFEFDKSHNIWRSSYVKQDNSLSYCGIINIYNFLHDSFKYNRYNDLGYVIGRVFINKEDHFFLEGKRQLGFLYNDIVHSVIDEKAIRNILESTILYCLNFDLYTPPFDSIKEVSVNAIQMATESMQIKTGKRLGFKFQADNDEID
ncbi:MAG: hypothetical protein ABI315_12900 [Bacteroidia bacterium]